MNARINDNSPAITGNVTGVSSSSTPSSSGLINDSPRRSARFSSGSPQVTHRSLNQSSIHRVLSGGVARSPKLSARRSTHAGDSSNAASQIIANDNVTTSDYSNISDLDLPLDQSDDEEMQHDNNQCTTVSTKSSSLVKRSQILSYFDEQINGFKCKICNKVYKATKLSDSNLRKHLSSSCHKIPNVLFKSQTYDNSKPNLTTISSERRKDLNDSIIDAVVQDGLAFDTFRRPGMAKFLSVAIPGYVAPHRKTIRRRIATLYSLHTKKLRDLVPRLGFLSLTSDIWKNSRQVHFIALTAHAFTSNYEHVPIVIGCRRILGQHTSVSIERYIKYELDRIGIKPSQVVSITTDNGSNIKKVAATLKFGAPISCMAHNLNLVVHKGLCLWIQPKAEDFPLDLELSSNEWEDLDRESDSLDDIAECDQCSIEAASDLVSEEEEEEKAERDLAYNDDDDDDDNDVDKEVNTESDAEDDIELEFASLQLNNNNSSSINHFELLKNVFELMKKSRLIIKFMRNHTITNEYIQKYMISRSDGKNTGILILDMIIRWNSSFLLIDRLINHKDVLNSMFAFPNNITGLTEQQIKKLKDLILNQHEWNLLNCLKNVLKPFLQTTTALSGQKYPTMALSFYVFRLLSHFLESTSDDDSITIALKESLLYWFNVQCKAKLPSGQFEIMMVAAFLDPSIYRVISDTDRKAAKKIIFKKLEKSNINHLTSLSSSTTTTTTIRASKLSPLEKLAAVCGHTISSTTVTEKLMTLDEEISSYIKEALSADDFQEFWTSYCTKLPRLSSLVRRINVIPATSVTSEALFSVASFLHRKQRASLSSRTLRYLLVLKNRQVLEKFE
ncbi:unnamed protein product [Rotaria magnacalcarata]|uniref:BED-type domain-containing protein n=2 Tax=Rotaria magnacalcarata TaxID=392030 RepID=A0A816H7K3_9BILA|nr:unnamed protein product [Rotaria magnacalcarata]